MKKIIFISVLFLISLSSFAQPYEGQQRRYTIATFSMLGWFPNGYAAESPFRYPLILHFVGAGCSDSTSTVGDGSGIGTIPKQLANATWDGRQFIPNGNYIADTAKYIVFTFTNTTDQSWPPNVDAVVTALLAAYRIDSTRMFLAGWSQGATDLLKFRGNVFEQALVHNEQIRKIFPIATGTTGLDATNWSTGDTVYGKFYVGSTDVTTGPTLTNGEAGLITANSPPNSYALVKLIEGSGHDVTDTAYQHDVLQAQYNAYIWFISDTAGNEYFTKINILPRMVWGVNGNFGTGSQSLFDTTVYKYGNIIGRAFTIVDGDGDPSNGQFDFDTTRPGFQIDTTLANGILQRPSVHNFWTMGLDSQIVVIIDLEQEYAFDEFWYNDSTGGAISGAADVTFGTLEDARALMLEFEGVWGTHVSDFSLNSSASVGYKQVNASGRVGQYIILRFNRVNGTYPNEVGAAFTTFYFYGTPTGNRDTRITPNWQTTIERDSSLAVSDLNGFVEAHPTPNYSNWRTDTAALWGGLGGYISATTSSNGVFDKYVGSFVGRSNTNVKWDAEPYGTPIYNLPDTVWRKSHKNYQVDRVANAYLFDQTSDGNLNWIPIDSATADRRRYSSYERYKFQFLRGASRLCYEIPDTTNNVGLYLREAYIDNNPHSGRYAWGLFDYYIPFNENWAGYRDGSVAGSNYQDPMALFSMHDNLKRGWDSVFDVMPFVTQGFAAWGMEGMIEAEFIGRVKYLNKEHPLGDILNMHPTISTWVRDVDGGCAGNYNSQGFLAGVRDERAKFQAFIDTMQILSGRKRKGIITEIAFESHYDPNFAIPDSTCSNGVSGLGVRQIGSEDTWTSQAITIAQANIHYYFIKGLDALFGYEMMDAADTAGAFYNSPDGAAGRVQGYHNWYKPSFFVEGQQHKWLANYRGEFIQSDSANGNFNGIMRNVLSTARDSFCLVVAWGSYTNAASARTYNLYSDVTAASKKVHIYGTDWTFDGTTTSPTVTSGTVSETPSQKPSYYFFKSPALAAALDNGHYFQVNKNVIQYSP